MDNLSFEEAMAKLEEIIQKMDSAEVKLENAVWLYEEGVKLKKICEEKLQSAKMKIEKITLSPAGKPTAEKFEEN